MIKLETSVPTTKRIAYINVVGKGWYGQTGAVVIQLRDYDLENIESFDRDSIESWLDRNTGDFQSIIDFEVYIGANHIPFQDESGENLFMDCMYPYDGE